MAAFFANLDVPTMVEPSPTNGSGRTGSLPSEIRPDETVSRAQTALWSVVPAQKPGTKSGFNGGTN